jgi:cell division transport system permease protein
MQLRYTFSELVQGLRRNLSMHIAVVLTIFVSMTLVGLGVLLGQQSGIATRHLGNQLQITVYLCRDGEPNAACVGEVTDEQKARVVEVMENNPEVASYRFESKEEAFEKVKELFGEDEFDGPNPALTANDMPESYWITLKDPDEYKGITSEVKFLDGVSQVRDLRETLNPMFQGLLVMQIASWAIAGFLVLAALLLVANTIRLAAFARRKEIGIMRLAAGALAGFTYFGVQQRIAEFISYMPWIGWDDYTLAVIVIAILGPVMTMLPTLLLTRKYLKV